MAGASFHIDLEDAALRQLLQQLQANAVDMSDVFADIGGDMLRATQTRYKDQIAPDGSAWQDIKDETKARKVRDEILIDSGDMLGDYHYEASAEALIFGNASIQAATHQFGDEDRNIEARPHLGMSAEDIINTRDTLVQYLLK